MYMCVYARLPTPYVYFASCIPMIYRCCVRMPPALHASRTQLQSHFTDHVLFHPLRCSCTLHIHPSPSPPSLSVYVTNTLAMHCLHKHVCRLRLHILMGAYLLSNSFLKRQKSVFPQHCYVDGYCSVEIQMWCILPG